MSLFYCQILLKCLSFVSGNKHGIYYYPVQDFCHSITYYLQSLPLMDEIWWIWSSILAKAGLVSSFHTFSLLYHLFCCTIFCCPSLSYTCSFWPLQTWFTVFSLTVYSTFFHSFVIACPVLMVGVGSLMVNTSQRIFTEGISWLSSLNTCVCAACRFNTIIGKVVFW